jgi:hypothetical protein
VQLTRSNDKWDDERHILLRIIMSQKIYFSKDKRAL